MRQLSLFLIFIALCFDLFSMKTNSNINIAVVADRIKADFNSQYFTHLFHLIKVFLS